MYLRNRIFLLFLFIAFYYLAQSKCLINTEDFSTGVVSIAQWPSASPVSKEEIKNAKREEKIILRTEKFQTKLEKVFKSKKVMRSIGNISDPVDRWLWIWAISWGVGMLMTLIAGGAIAATAIGIIWLVAFSVGAAALIIWLIKKFR